MSARTTLQSILLLSILLAGCGPRTSQGLVGRYSAQFAPQQNLELILKSDGSFEQYLHVPGKSSELVATGTWAYDPGNSPGSSRIDLTNLLNITGEDCGNSNGGGCRLGDKGNASFPVERNYMVGTLRLGVEYAHPYVKQASE